MTTPATSPKKSGPNKGEGGRPTLPAEDRRVRLNTRVAPETLAALRAMPGGIGAAIDRLVTKKITLVVSS